MQVRLASLGVLAGAALVGSAGCMRVKGDKVEALIRAQLDQVGAKSADITCPDEVEPRRDDEFECTVELDGVRFDVVVKQLDDKGTVATEPIGHVLSTERVAANIETQAAARGHAIEVSCADVYWVHEAGELHECTVDGQSSVIKVVLGQEPGLYDWSVSAR